MHRSSDVVVVPRNLRWEVSVAGITRPMVDWFATKDRAIDHALEVASERDRSEIVVETSDGAIEAVLTIDRDRNSARRRAG